MARRLGELGPTAIDDTVEELSRWSSFRDDDDELSSWDDIEDDDGSYDDEDDYYDEEFEADEDDTVRAPSAVENVRNSSPRVGRNSPCPCGSGKKFKRCCWGKYEPDEF
jgi:hypothetical protein